MSQESPTQVKSDIVQYRLEKKNKTITTQTAKKCPRGKQTSSLETIKSRNSERKISE